MAKKKETVEIPISLARLLASEKENMKNPEEYEQVQEVAKALLKLLIAT